MNESERGGAAIYLTFDDGPDPEWTPRILDELARWNLRATFFVVGRAARCAPQLLQRATREGHEIANHTWNHRHPWTLSAKSACTEVRVGSAIIADIIGQTPRLFRPPHGRVRRAMADAAQEQGQALTLWTLSAKDWSWLGESRAIANRLQRVRAREVVLMHDGANRVNRPESLLAVLPRFFALLQARRLSAELLPTGESERGTASSPYIAKQ